MGDRKGDIKKKQPSPRPSAAYCLDWEGGGKEAVHPNEALNVSPSTHPTF